MEAFEKLYKGVNLGFEEATAVFNEILDGNMEETRIEEFLVLLAKKGETVEEVAASAKALSEHAVKLDHNFDKLLDTCGTGGDGSGSFNISTAAALICSLFLPVAKHGNRAASSKSGSADVLEALNIPIDLEKEEALRFLKKKNFVFLFAQKYHPAMKFVAGVRKKIGTRTIFNLIGPLCNPAKPNHQLIGVFRKDFLQRYLGAVEFLDIPNVMLVSGNDGLDEVSISEKTACYHKKGSLVKYFEFDPKELGIYASQDAIKGYEPDMNARIMKEIFMGNHKDLINAVAINAAFALVLADVEDDIGKAFVLAREQMKNKKAYEKLMELTA
jgi:anthranilate phosphoribosyltransferase